MQECFLCFTALLSDFNFVQFEFKAEQIRQNGREG
jgi:hypothetical protein